MSEDDKKGKTLKYIWQDGDYKLVSEKEFNELVEKGEITLYDFKKEFSCCHKSICCSCEEEDINIAKEVSFKIFQFIKKEYFNSLFKNEPFKPTIIKIFNNLISLSKNVLPEEIVLTKQIYCAVYMSLLDSLGKDKDIKLTEEDVETLMKSFNSTLQNINREKLIKDFKLKLKKKAIVFETGGIRPTNQLGESWIGKVCWQLLGEKHPIGKNGCPMTAIATIFVPESDCVPNALKDIKMISIFIDDDFWNNLDAEDLKEYFIIRTYNSLENLVPCDYHNHEILLSFPLVPRFVEDEFPNDSDYTNIGIFDVIYKLEQKSILNYNSDIYENNETSHKLGGYPFSIQDSVNFDEGYEFVLQIASDEKADINIVDNGKFYFAYNPQTKDWSVKCQFY